MPTQNGSELENNVKAIIAVDLDDVLSSTNEHIAAWHNDQYGSNISLNDFYYYYYWKNPCWGPPAQTHQKVKKFYATNWIESILPIDGAQEGIAALRRLGYRLVIITARNQHLRDASWEWVQRHFPSCFDEIICTGQFALQQRLEDVPGVDQNIVIPKKLTKAEVCIRIGAKLLIDDSLENTMACAEYVSPTGDVAPPVLIFGDYQWNTRLSLPEDECDDMAYARRVEFGDGDTGFLMEDTRLAEEALARVNEKRRNFVQRAKNWKEVLSSLIP